MPVLPGEADVTRDPGRPATEEELEQARDIVAALEDPRTVVLGGTPVTLPDGTVVTPIELLEPDEGTPA